MKNINYTLSLLVLVSFLFTSCEKEFIDPETRTIAEGTVVSISDVRAMETPGVTYTITEDISVYGVVTIDETTGNLYKESYITDATGNLYLRFTASSGLYIGDSIRVNLKGAKILRYNQMLQIDSLHPDNNIVKIATQVYKTPQLVSIDDLLNNMESSQGKLVQIDNSWFAEKGLGKAYADAATQTAVSRVLQDLNGGSIDVRTSGYANFASDTLPDGVGTFIGVVAQYNSGLQLIIRNPNELSLNGVAPTVKDFQDNSLTSGGWLPYLVSGPALAAWTTYTSGTNTLAKATNFDGSSNFACESWMISPASDFSNSTTPTLSLGSVYKYTGAVLQVLVSTDYDGISDPSLGTFTWTPIAVPLDPAHDDWNLVPSGNVSLSAFNGAPSVYVGFKYTGSNSDGSTWEIDNIIINK
jgi:hypothetical protein